MRESLKKYFIYENPTDRSLRLNGSINRRMTAMAISILLFIMLLIFVKSGITDHMDTEFDQWAYGLRNGSLNRLLIIITHMGSAPVIIGIIAVLLVLPSTRLHYGVPTMTISLFSVIIYKILKILIARPRPDLDLRLVAASGYSFPSGHSMNSVIFYGMIIFLILRNSENRRVKRAVCTMLPILLFLIGFSRIYLACHFLTDVMAGWLLGITMVMAVSIAFDEINRNLTLE